MQTLGQGECHSEEASLLLEAGIISGTEFLKTDFPGQIHLGQIPKNYLLFLWKLQEQSQIEAAIFKE